MTCKVKNNGKVLLFKGATIVVDKEGEEPYELNANTFYKRYSKSYPDSGPDATVAFASQGSTGPVGAELINLDFNKENKETKLRFRIAADDRAGLASFDPSSGECAMEFFTPCGPPPPPSPPPSTSCSYTDETCAEGTVCPAGTAVSAECADPAENGNPCACTALQQLAALKASVASELPWSDLANNNYCVTDFGAPINVFCEEVSGVNLPLRVTAFQAGLNGEMPTSVGDLGPSMRTLNLESNFINSVATEIGALTDLLDLNMRDNFLASLPAEIGDLTDLTLLDLSFNALTSLPTEIGLMRSLFTLTVTTNLLTAVPTEIGALTSLNFLRLGANELTAVPTEIGALANLVKLELGFNSLETVPSEMAALTLDTLNLEANNLIDVPEEFRTVSPGNECKFNGNPLVSTRAAVPGGRRGLTPANPAVTVHSPARLQLRQPRRGHFVLHHSQLWRHRDVLRRRLAAVAQVRLRASPTDLPWSGPAAARLSEW